MGASHSRTRSHACGGPVVAGATNWVPTTGRTELINIASALEGLDTVYGQFVGEGGDTPPAYGLFLELKRTATPEELRAVVRRTDSQAALRCYALWALADDHILGHDDVVQLLGDTRRLSFALGGCGYCKQSVVWFAIHVATERAPIGALPLHPIYNFVLRDVKGDLGDYSARAASTCADLELLLHAWRNGNPAALRRAAQLSSDQSITAALVEVCRVPNPVSCLDDDGLFSQDARRVVFECVAGEFVERVCPRNSHVWFGSKQTQILSPLRPSMMSSKGLALPIQILTMKLRRCCVLRSLATTSGQQAV